MFDDSGVMRISYVISEPHPDVTDGEKIGIQCSLDEMCVSECNAV